MPRIRTIKPEFPQSESMGRVSRDARLTFVLLWTISDDEGRLRGNSRMLASLLFPYDADAPGLIDGWLTELEREKCVIRYKVDGDCYIEIPNWLSHQKIDHPSKSKIKPFAKSRERLAKTSVGSKDQGPRTKEGIGAKDTSRRVATPSVSDVAAYCAERSNGIDAAEFFDFYEANGWVQGKGKAIKDWRAAVRNWERRRDDFQKPEPSKAGKPLSMEELSDWNPVDGGGA
jgi:hypothetical protein